MRKRYELIIWQLSNTGVLLLPKLDNPAVSQTDKVLFIKRLPA